jgi:hypothetical protein
MDSKEERMIMGYTLDVAVGKHNMIAKVMRGCAWIVWYIAMILAVCNMKSLDP